MILVGGAWGVGTGVPIGTPSRETTAKVETRRKNTQKSEKNRDEQRLNSDKPFAINKNKSHKSSETLPRREANPLSSCP